MTLRRFFGADYSKRHAMLAWVVGAYLLVGVVLLCLWYRWQINPDATSYYTIAEKYAHGNFRQAVNGYWGPLLSWLLVPFVWMHVELDLAARLIGLVLGGALVGVVYRFLYCRQVIRPIVLVTISIAAIWSLEWVLTQPITPDLLLTLLVIVFCDLLLAFMAHPAARTAVVLGLVGVAMYFAKGFGLFLFVGVMGLVFAWQWLIKKQDFGYLLKRYAPVVAVLALVVVPYVAVISVKYHQPTINQAGDYNYRVAGPDVNHRDPETVTGPWNPPNATAMSVWEQPITVINAMPTWSPLASRENAVHFLHILGKNLSTSLEFFKDTNPMYTLGALALIVGCFQKGRFQREYAVLTAVTLVMIAGYSLVLTETRYLWPGAIAALLGLALCAVSFERLRVLSRLQGGVLAVLLLVITAASFAQVAVSQHHMWARYYQGQHAQIPALKAHVPKGSRTISDTFYSFYQCHYLQAYCYSVIDPPLDPMARQEYYQRLKDQNIVYLLDLHSRDADENLQLFKAEHYVQTYSTTGLTVYELR